MCEGYRFWNFTSILPSFTSLSRRLKFTAFAPTKSDVYSPDVKILSEYLSSGTCIGRINHRSWRFIGFCKIYIIIIKLDFYILTVQILQLTNLLCVVYCTHKFLYCILVMKLYVKVKKNPADNKITPTTLGLFIEPDVISLQITIDGSLIYF